MEKEELLRLVDSQTRLLLILGFAKSVILELSQTCPDPKLRENIRWILKAIDGVVYQDKPLPPFPER